MAGEILIPAALLGAAAALTASRARRREAEAAARFPAIGRFIALPGGRIHMVDRGEGPAVVLIHGAGGNLHDLLPLADRIAAQGYRTLTVDRPGCGWSDDFGHPGVAAQAALLRDAVAMAGAVRPVVLGQSLGGTVALGWAANHPESLAAVVPVSAPTRPWPGSREAQIGAAFLRATGWALEPAVAAWSRRSQVDRTLAQVFAPQPVPPGYAALAAIPLGLRRSALHATVRHLAGLDRDLATLAPRLSGIAVPLEAVHGDADAVVPVGQADALPATVTRLAGIGHMPHHSTPDAVLAAFLRAAERAGLRPVPQSR